MGLADLFDSIMIINAWHRTDRREELRSVLHRVGWDPDGPKMTWFPAIDPKTAVGFSSPGSVVFPLAHRCPPTSLAVQAIKRVLVLEDDCDFDSDFRDRQVEIASKLEATPWGIAYLGHVESISGPPRLVPGVQIRTLD